MSIKNCTIVLIAVCLSCTMTLSPAQADYIRLNDTFDSESATRYDDANDPLDADWWAIGPSIVDPATDMFLTTDAGAGGINSGNALHVNASGAVGPIWANFSAVNLVNVGDWMELTFDVRLPATSERTTGFRFGLYSTGGTTPPAADKIDDQLYLNDLDGYLVLVGTGDGTPVTNNSIRVRRETEDGGALSLILSGSAADQNNYNVPKGTAELDTNMHTIGLKLVRTDTGAMGAGMQTVFSIDGMILSDTIDDGSLGGTGADPYGFLSSFDGFCLSHIDSDYDFLVDNILVTTNVPVPEPSTLTLLVSGLIGLLAYAWRKQK